MPISFRLSSRKKEKKIKRNMVLATLGLATTIASVIVVHSSQTKKTIDRAYEFGVSDGINLARDFNRARSQQIEREMINTKYGRYAKVVE